MSTRGSFIIHLLRKRYRRFFGPDPHLQTAASGRDREVPIAKAANEVKGLARRLLSCQAQRVLGHRRLDRRAHLRRRAEEAIGGRQPLHRLVRPLEVVVLNKQRRSPLAVLEVREHGPREELLPHRLPEALDLAAGLRVVRPALHMADAMAPELFLEARLASPRRVLAPLVGENLARRPIVRDATGQSFHHERTPLVVRHHQTHEVARVIIEERRHVEPLVLAQQEREEVRLPELVGLGALEAALARPGIALHRRSQLRQALAFQHPAHRRVGGANTEETSHHIANAPAPGIGLETLRFDHRLAP